jgi:hypothetical protein
VKLDLLVVEDHSATAINDVIKLIRPLVVVKFGVGDFNLANLAGSGVLLVDQKADLAAGFCPRLNFRRVSPEEMGLSRRHKMFLSGVCNIVTADDIVESEILCPENQCRPIGK